MESALRALQPAPAGLGRDALMYRAGQLSMGQKRWLWPASTAAMALIAAGLAGTLWVRSSGAAPERIVYVPVPQAMEPARAASGSIEGSDDLRGSKETASSQVIESRVSYAFLREQVARHGVDALPEAPSVTKSSTIDRYQPRQWWKEDNEKALLRF
jgi:hypothetical protein